MSERPRALTKCAGGLPTIFPFFSFATAAGRRRLSLGGSTISQLRA
jgi:hypothetical protein